MALDNIPAQLSVLHTDILAERMEPATRGIHTVKGVAMTLGAVALAEYSREVEAAVIQGHFMRAIELYPALQSAFEELRGVLEKLFPIPE